MKVKAILTPAEKLTTLKTTDTIKMAENLISSHGFLSLPVVDGKKYIGFLSKQYIYDKFFKTGGSDLNAFLQSTVEELVGYDVDPVSPETDVEIAANLFFKNKLRFIPVVDKHGEFVGIVTQNSIFGLLTKVYGLEDPKISIYVEDIKGALGKIAEIISKNGGNITNIALLETEAMGIKEISVRVVDKNLESIRKKLEEKGFQTRK